MKIFTPITLLLLITFFIFSCSDLQKDPRSVISFNIEGYGSDTIQFSQWNPLTFEKMTSRELVLDASGSGSIEMECPTPFYEYINIGDFTFPLIHVAGAELSISGTMEDLPNTLMISGKGSLANNYLQEKKAIGDKFITLDGLHILSLDSLEFWERIRSMNAEIDSLNTWLASQKIDEVLETLLLLESKQLSNAYILNYALGKRYRSQAFQVDMAYDPGLFTSNSSAYSMALEFNYQYELLGPIWEATGASDSDSIEYIFPRLFAEALDTMEIPDQAKEYYTARLLVSYFGENSSTPVLEELYSEWKNTQPGLRYRETLSELYAQMSSLARGVAAPNIIGIDRYGEVFSMDALKGKVIYIDVWATWCSPCRKKLPDMYTLMEEFREFPDIKFLFISVDEDLEKWQKHLSTLPHGGIHLNAESKKLRQDYMIPGIPHYIIIDALGNIYQSNAPDPDTEEIKSILKEIADKAS